MDIYKDATGLFEDFNFKLVVIDSLLNQSPSFESELEILKEKYVDKFEWYSGSGPIEEMLKFFSNLKLELQDLDKIIELCFDGGNEIYHLIQPDWDGEDSRFDVQSVSGFEHLKNLKRVCYISMCDEETILNPLSHKGIEIT